MNDSTFGISGKGRRGWSSAKERRQWIQAWEASGQTQDAFARERGLCVGTLRNWIRRERIIAGPVTLQEVSLAEVLKSEASTRSGDWEFEVRLPGGIAMSVRPGTPANRVRELVEALRC